jgi:hypothetical protein
MRFRLVIRIERWRRAVSVGVAATLASVTLLPLTGSAATTRIYRDEFLNESYNGSDGTDSWGGPWIESGESDGPGDGAIEVPSDGHCHTDRCLRIGQYGVDAAAVSRQFDSSGAGSVVLTFDYKRHPHATGLGLITLSASPDGISWTQIDQYWLTVDDGSQQVAVYDLTAYAGSNSAIRFDLALGTDDSHMNIDNLEIVVDPADAPIFDQDLADRTDAEADVISISAGASHPSGDTLSYSASGLPPGISIDSATGTLSGTIGYTAAAASPYAVTLTVTDSDGDLDQDAFTWTVIDTNRDPTASDVTTSVAEDTSTGVTIDLLDPLYSTDPDGDSLTLDGIDLTGLVGGTVTDHGDGTITYTPNPDFDGSDSFGYTVGDGRGGADSATVTVTVTPAGDAPTLSSPASFSIAEGTLASFTATATDPDTVATLTFSLVAGPDPVPAGANIDPSTGDFAWLTGEADGPGLYRFAGRVTDDTGLTDEAPLAVDVAEANQAPVLAPIGSKTSAEGAIVDFLPAVSDPDVPAMPLTFAVTGLPPGLGLDTTTGRITGAPTYSSSGTYTVVLSVFDSGSPPLADSVTFTWVVANTNRAPQLTPPSDLVAGSGEAVSVIVAATDPDGEDLFFAAAGLPDGLSIHPGTGRIAGTTPVVDEFTAFEVTVTVTDSLGKSTSARFTIGVEPPPVTTTTTTTTTSTPITTTTTVPRSTTSTAAGTTTTTTTSSSTTTTLGGGSPPNQPPQPPGALTVEEAIEAKSGLVVTIELGGGASSRPAGETSTRDHLDPMEGLTVTFTTAVETLGQHLLASVVLGVIMSILVLLGVDRREDKTAPGVLPAA